MKFKATRRVAHDTDSRYVGRHKIRRELNSSEPQAERTRECADENRLGCSRHAFEKSVSSCQESDQCLFDNGVLSDDSGSDDCSNAFE
jgi:hypothetical protein